jgi:hypothetical protein
MKKSIKIIGLFTIVLIMLLTTKVNAGMQVKSGTSSWDKITVSESYSVCYDLRNSDSTLGKNTLDPHLVLNKDWSAAAYLGVSSYGSISDNTPRYYENGQYYYTINGNKTGVTNLGSNYTKTSSLLEGFNEENSNISKLVENKNTKYVEIIDVNRTIEKTKGQALAETWGWFYNNASNNTAWTEFCSDYPVLIRSSYFGVIDGRNFSKGSGVADGNTTFRPVIWN